MTAAVPLAAGSGADLAQARALGAARIEQWRRGLADPVSPQALEYSKAAIGRGDIECGLSPEGTSARGHGALAAVRFWLAALAAWVMLAVALCLSPRSGARPQGRRGIALHGELSNRTRHVLEAAAAGERPDFVLVLGMPRTGLGQVQTAWAPLLGPSAPPLSRPVSLVSLLGSLPPALHALSYARTVERSCPVRPRWREQVAILARVLLGEASARWWSRHGCPARIQYGHTGTADTTRLELAQQAAGCVTVHAVHGISGGRNFIGRSDVAVFRCGHDADWHARLGGYGRCEYVPAAQPAWRRGESGLLLLSSLAHPMYLGWQLHGIAEESALLDVVAHAADAAQVQGPRYWMPHPALGALPVAQQRALRDQASRLGFSAPPTGVHFSALANEVRRIVSSESTVAIELLAQGQLPVLWRSPWSVPECALARYAPIATDAATLTTNLRAHDEELSEDFAATWQAIRPSGKAK